MRASRVSERVQYNRSVHTLTSLIEVSREYKMSLCLTSIDLKAAFDAAETEAVIEALGNQGVPTQYIRMLRELYDNFTTRISPLYKEVIINVKRGVRQGDTISPKLFNVALENIMHHLEWEDSGVKVDGRSQTTLAYNTEHRAGGTNASRVRQCLWKDRLGNEDDVYKNGLVLDAPFTLNGTNISECSSYVSLVEKST
nr:RNA-directed DNA polymerase (reverse transcriptase) domain containing protein [Haemonchus contortus]